MWYAAHLILIEGTFVNVLLALSIQIPLRMGVFSLAGVGCYGIGSYTAGIIVVRWGWPALPAIAAGMVLAAGASYLLSLLIQRLAGLYLAMATVAFDLILSVVAINGGSLTGGSAGLFGAVTNLSVPEIAIVTVVILAVAAYTERGRLGRRITSIHDDQDLAAAMGANVPRMRRMAIVAAGVVGACGGGMNALLYSTVSPSGIGFDLIVLALTMIIVGGAGSWVGAVIGSVIFTWLPSVLAVVGGAYKDIVYGVLVVLAAVWVPGGVLGIATDGYRRLMAGRRGPLPGLGQGVQADGLDPAVADLARLLNEPAEERTG